MTSDHYVPPTHCARCRRLLLFGEHQLAVPARGVGVLCGPCREHETTESHVLADESVLLDADDAWLVRSALADAQGDAYRDLLSRLKSKS
jgi:hypothetical protein